MGRTSLAGAVTEQVLANLAAFWDDPAPSRYTGRPPERIAGSRHDQAIPRGASNPYWEIIRQMPLSDDFGYGTARPEPDPHFFDPRHPARLTAGRHALCATYSWSIPSPGDIAWITARLAGRSVVEPGAGGGYWAWQLAQAGVDVAAYDPGGTAAARFVTGEPWFPVRPGDDSAVADHPGRALLLCWPSYSDPWAARALAAYGGGQLFYVGEGDGGCCADDELFGALRGEWEEAGDCPAHVSYRGIHCRLAEYRRAAR
jgi:hypothetical protein